MVSQIHTNGRPITYNATQRSYIEGLRRDIEGNAVPMAVVDCYASHPTTTPHNILNERFQTRDMRHVKIYGLHVLWINNAAYHAGHKMPEVSAEAAAAIAWLNASAEA
jgi:hypothetical protein